MKGSISRFTWQPVFIALLVSNMSCALRVNVREDWNGSRQTEIPLQGAAVTWQQIRKGQMPDPQRMKEYNAAVRNSVVQIGLNWAEDRPLSVVTTADGDVKIEVRADELLSHHPIDQVVPAEFLRVKRGFDSDVFVDGVGTPLIVRQPRTDQNPMIPESGLSR